MAQRIEVMLTALRRRKRKRVRSKDDEDTKKEGLGWWCVYIAQQLLYNNNS